MTYSFELPLLILLILTAGGAIFVKDLLSSVLILGSYSFFLALVWAWLGAVDVAFVEAVVGAGLATVFFVITLFGIDPRDTLIRRTPPPIAAVVSLLLLGLLLLYAANDLAAFGDSASPASTHVSILRTVSLTPEPRMSSPQFSWTTERSTLSWRLS